MARVLLISLLVAHLLIFLPNPAAILAAESTNESVIDRRALLSFMQAASDPLGALSSWGGNASLYCSWRGVTCGDALPSPSALFRCSSTLCSWLGNCRLPWVTFLH